ncbi:MAG: hypothetical protein IJF45_05195 [Clostridia bacterium]|nr:hypothetical protein [Clostridia bacterium]
MTDHSKCFSIPGNSDIAKGDDRARISLYAHIGFFIEIVQMLEFNLRKLICYERSVLEIESEEQIDKNGVLKICEKYDCYYGSTYDKKMTLGKLISELSTSTCLEEKFLLVIRDINEYRIVIVHELFQNNIGQNHMSSAELVNQYIKERLLPQIDVADALNKTIIRITKEYAHSLNNYKRKFQIPFEE